MTFEEFARLRLASLLRFAVVLTGDRNLAEDIVQDVLLKARGRWQRIAAVELPEAYVRRILVNEHISWWRRFGRRELASGYQGKEKTGLDPADASAQRLDLAAALARLPKRQRAVIILRFYEDLTEAETAAAMGCSVGTVKSQASAGLARLRRLLSHSDFGVPHAPAR